MSYSNQDETFPLLAISTFPLNRLAIWYLLVPRRASSICQHPDCCLSPNRLHVWWGSWTLWLRQPPSQRFSFSSWLLGLEPRSSLSVLLVSLCSERTKNKGRNQSTNQSFNQSVNHISPTTIYQYYTGHHFNDMHVSTFKKAYLCVLL